MYTGKIFLIAVVVICAVLIVCAKIILKRIRNTDIKRQGDEALKILRENHQVQISRIEEQISIGDLFPAWATVLQITSEGIDQLFGIDPYAVKIVIPAFNVYGEYEPVRFDLAELDGHYCSIPGYVSTIFDSLSEISLGLKKINRVWSDIEHTFLAVLPFTYLTAYDLNTKGLTFAINGQELRFRPESNNIINKTTDGLQQAAV